MVQFRYAALCILIICDTCTVLYYNFKLGMKSVLIKETMKEIKGNIIGSKLLLNSGAKIKFHIRSRVQYCYNTITFSTSQCQDGVKVLKMKMSGSLKDFFENLKTRNSASRILTGIFSKKLENSAIKAKFRP